MKAVWIKAKHPGTRMEFPGGASIAVELTPTRVPEGMEQRVLDQIRFTAEVVVLSDEEAAAAEAAEAAAAAEKKAADERAAAASQPPTPAGPEQEPARNRVTR